MRQKTRIYEEGCSMNIRSNSNFKSVELFDGEIDIYTLIKQPDFTIHASSERSERFRKALELNEQMAYKNHLTGFSVLIKNMKMALNCIV